MKLSSTSLNNFYTGLKKSLLPLARYECFCDLDSILLRLLFLIEKSLLMQLGIRVRLNAGR